MKKTSRRRPRPITPKLHSLITPAVFKDELSACRCAYEASGNVRVLQDALLICAEQGRPLPHWLTAALLPALDVAADPREQDLEDYSRFLAVCEGRDLGMPWRTAYEYAAALLAPVPGASGGIDTMEKAYKRVTRALRDAPGRYHIQRDELVAARRLAPYQPTAEHAEATLRTFLEK